MQTHVGYTTHTIPEGQFGMIGVQFEGTDSQDMTLEKLIQGEITPIECDWEEESHSAKANMIEVYKGNDDYDFFYYLSDGWDDDLNDGEGDYFTGWCDGSGYKARVTLAPGEAIWFKARTGEITFTTPGQVYMGEAEITVPNGQFQMFANSMPTQLDFNDNAFVSYENLVAEECDWEEETHSAKANMIEVYKGNDDYDFFYYLSGGWDDAALDGEGDWFTGWCDGSGYKQIDKVPVGRGMWAKGRKGEFKIIFNKAK